MRVSEALVLMAVLGPAAFPAAMALPQFTVTEFAIHVGGVQECASESNQYTLWGSYRWASTPVKVYFDTAASSKKKIPAQFLAEVKAGLAAWEDQEHPAGALTTEVSSAPSNGLSVYWANIDGPLKTLAVTRLWVLTGTTTVAKVTITFDKAENWVTGVPSGCPAAHSGISVADVSTHEFGHGIAMLSHTSQAGLTMQPYYGGGYERTPALGDRLGLDAVYP